MSTIQKTVSFTSAEKPKTISAKEDGLHKKSKKYASSTMNHVDIKKALAQTPTPSNTERKIEKEIKTDQKTSETSSKVSSITSFAKK